MQANIRDLVFFIEHEIEKGKLIAPIAIITPSVTFLAPPPLSFIKHNKTS